MYVYRAEKCDHYFNSLEYFVLVILRRRSIFLSLPFETLDRINQYSNSSSCT